MYFNLKTQEALTMYNNTQLSLIHKYARISEIFKDIDISKRSFPIERTFLHHDKKR